MFHTLYQLSFVALTTINWKRFHVKSSYSCLHPDQKHRLGASDGLQAVVATIYCHLTRPINIELHSDIGKKSKTASLLRSDLIYAAIDSKCAERHSVHFCMISTLIQHFQRKSTDRSHISDIRASCMPTARIFCPGKSNI